MNKDLLLKLFYPVASITLLIIYEVTKNAYLYNFLICYYWFVIIFSFIALAGKDEDFLKVSKKTSHKNKIVFFLTVVNLITLFTIGWYFTGIFAIIATLFIYSRLENVLEENKNA